MAKRQEIEDLKKLTVESIRDYHVCSLFYKYRYMDQLPEVIEYKRLISNRFHSTLGKVASYFFYRKQAGATAAYKTVVNKWEKLWFPKEMDAYDLAVQKHTIQYGNIATMSNSAVAALELFYNDFVQDEGIPVAIKESYITPMRFDIHLESEVDLILRYPNKRIKAIKWLDNMRHGNMNFMSMEFAAMKIAIDHHLGPDVNVTYHLYDLSSSTRSYVELPQPSQDDMRAFFYWAYQIADSETFVPRRGFTAYCKGCPFDEQCLEFSQWPIGTSAAS